MTPSCTRANIVPSAKMPAPPNMRRTATGPKAANSSRMSSGDTAAFQWMPLLVRLGRRLRGRLELHRLAATAGRGLVRVVEDELRGELVGLVVHLGAEQEQHRLGIDEHPHALVLDHLVELLDALGIFHGVGHAGTAAVLDADAHADYRLHRIGHHVFDALGGGVGEPDHLGSRPVGHLPALLSPGARPGSGLRYVPKITTILLL